MWTAGYFTRFVDRWVPALYNLPRWLSGNGYPTLTNTLTVPPVSGFSLSSLVVAPTGTAVPLAWILTQYATPSTGNVLQGLFEPFAAEFEILKANLDSLWVTTSHMFDMSDAEWAWIVQHSTDIEQLEVKLSDGSWRSVTKAGGMNDLLHATDWSWLPGGYSALLYGLDLQETLTENRVDDWLFVGRPQLWRPEGALWIEHPVTRRWFPLHPSTVRSDGYINFWYDGNVRVRSHFTALASSLTSVQVRVNGQVETMATRVDLWNSLDEMGLLTGVSRLPGEMNTDYAEALLQYQWFASNTQQGMRNGLSAMLRTGVLGSFSPSVSSYTFPATGTGVTVRGLQQYQYVSETLPYEDGSTNLWRTRFAAPDRGQVYLNTLPVPYTMLSAASGILQLDTSVNNRTDKPRAKWQLRMWETTNTNIVLTSNYPSTANDIVLLVSRSVRVEDPSDFTKRKSFKKTSPIYKWQAWGEEENPDTLLLKPEAGLAKFV